MQVLDSPWHHEAVAMNETVSQSCKVGRHLMCWFLARDVSDSPFVVRDTSAGFMLNVGDGACAAAVDANSATSDSDVTEVICIMAS
jgi:hypothetical protein